VAHGLLTAEKPHHTLFIPRESIKIFRLRKRIMGET
jgi:hypothetical protein